MQPPIALTGLVLDTPLLDEMAAFYTDSFGLAVVKRDRARVTLAGGGITNAPQITLRRSATARLGGLCFAMRDQAAVDRGRQAAHATGLSLADTNEAGFALVDPDGTPLTFAVDSTHPLADTDGPLFVSHVVLNSTDPARMIGFYTNMLGFTVSDRYEHGTLTFLRCDQPQHHCVGIAPGAVNGLNHFAMDCGDVNRVMRGISRMTRAGYTTIWGPGRHGPGGNIFAYFEDPTGFVAEYTCDVLQIDDTESWTAQEWVRTPETGNTWLSGGPSPRAIALMSGTAFPAERARPKSTLY